MWDGTACVCDLTRSYEKDSQCHRCESYGEVPGGGACVCRAGFRPGQRSYDPVNDAYSGQKCDPNGPDNPDEPSHASAGVVVVRSRKVQAATAREMLSVDDA